MRVLPLPESPYMGLPLVFERLDAACRRGNDMHALDSSFPGINANGGYAQYLLTGQRSLIKLPKSLAPKDVAPYTDAGLTALNARWQSEGRPTLGIGIGVAWKFYVTSPEISERLAQTVVATVQRIRGLDLRKAPSHPLVERGAHGPHPWSHEIRVGRVAETEVDVQAVLAHGAVAAGRANLLLVRRAHHDRDLDLLDPDLADLVGDPLDLLGRSQLGHFQPEELLLLLNLFFSLLKPFNRIAAEK